MPENAANPQLELGGPPREPRLNLASPQTTAVLGLSAVNSLHMHTTHLSGWLEERNASYIYSGQNGAD